MDAQDYTAQIEAPGGIRAEPATAGPLQST